MVANVLARLGLMVKSVMIAMKNSLDTQIVQVSVLWISPNWTLKIFLLFIGCNCDVNGSNGVTCDKEGECSCKETNIVGDKCDLCGIGDYGFPNCQSRFLCQYFLKRC